MGHEVGQPAGLLQGWSGAPVNYIGPSPSLGSALLDFDGHLPGRVTRLRFHP